MNDALRIAAQALNAHGDTIAARVMERHYALDPEYARSLTDYQRSKCLQDVRYHLMYLANALATASPGVFVSYAAWARDLLRPMGVRSQDVVRNMRILRDVVAESLPDTVRHCLGAYFEPAVSALEEVHDGLPSEIAESNPFRSLAKRYLDALLATRRDIARDVILTAIRDGASVADIYLCVIAPVQREIGRLWQLGQITVAQEHYCTAATQLNINHIYDQVFAGDRSDKTIVATCVGGELHELPARMLSDFFELAGWNSHYLGANTPTPAILRFIADVKPQVLGISATMAFHLQAVRDLVAEVRRSEAVPDLRILVGGHPFIRDPSLCSAVGADGCAPDGPRAVALAESLL